MNEAVENNLRKYFWEFVKNDRQTTGPDTHLAMVAEHFNKNKSPEIQAWQGGCYVNPYNVPTGYHVWKNWNYKEVLKDNEKFYKWVCDNWYRFSLRTERRAVRTPEKFTKCLTQYAKWVDTRLMGLLKIECSDEKRYEIIWQDLSNEVWGMGRYALLKLLEVFERSKWKVALSDIRPIGGDSPRQMLARLYNDPDLESGNDELTLQKIQACVQHLRQEGIEKGIYLTMFNAEVYLCEFGQALKKNQYAGRGLDSEMGHWDKIAALWEEDNFNEFWEVRKKMFPRWALGELNNWQGRRKELGECLTKHGYTWSDKLYEYNFGMDLSKPKQKNLKSVILYNPYPNIYVSEDTRRFHENELLETINKKSISLIVNATKRSPDSRLINNENFIYKHLAMNDTNINEQVMKELKPIIDNIISQIKNGNSVLINCYNAWNRSFFIAGLSMLSLGLSGKNVVRRIKTVRPVALKNENFKNYLLKN